MFKLSRVFALLACPALVESLAFAPPPISESVWATAWTANLTEGVGSAEGSAQYFYDYSQKSEKWIRPTGEYSQDGVCSHDAKQSKSEPCVDLVTQGYRYIIHPRIQGCCLLGTFEHGCGPIRPDWIEHNNGTYVGQQTIGGVLVNGWNVQGFSKNTWYQTADASKLPVKMEQGTFIDVYDRSTYSKADSLPKSTFDIPSYCSPANKCPNQSPCSLGLAH
jgi:hypothetical protein